VSAFQRFPPSHRLLLILLGSAQGVVNEVSVSQQLARRDRHFLYAGNNPERANAAQAPAPLGANIYGLTLSRIPSEVILDTPADCPPGIFPVILDGPGVLGCKRFVEITTP
jgi:hypothetical protein